MPKRLYLLLCVAALAATTVVVTPAAGQDVPAPPVATRAASDPFGSPPTVDSVAAMASLDRSASPVDLVDGVLRQAVTDLGARGSTEADVSLDGGRVRVEILHHGSDRAIRDLVDSLGGTIDGAVPGLLAEGEVPVDRLEALESSALVDSIQPPLPVNEPSPPSIEGTGGIGEAVDLTNADHWQDIGGYRGAGVQIGIIDNFGATNWSEAETADEVPAPTATFCRSEGAECTLFAGSEAHGVAVAEVIHDMAPDAELFLADVGSTADLQAAIVWFDNQGVDIISRSTVSPYDGSGWGTGPVATVVKDAIHRGMVWFQAVGNNAGEEGVRYGSYHRWRFADVDNDHFVEFAPGDEVLEFWCGDQIGLRWNDSFSGGLTGASDYDMYVFDPATAGDPEAEPVDQSTNDQVGGAHPIERTTECVPGWNYLVVWQYAAGSSSNDLFEFAMDGVPVARWQNPYSAAVPAADLLAQGAVAVGSIDPAAGVRVANYSSRGPTNQGVPSPAVVAPSCLTSFAYGPDCFAGTGASAAVVAGGAALVLEAGRVRWGSQLGPWVRSNATIARGAPGRDNSYGWGQFALKTAMADLSIRVGGTGSFRGDNVMGVNGSGQGAESSGPPGSTRYFTVRVRNRGLAPDRFRIQADGSTPKFIVTYRFGGANRTRQVVNGTLVTPVIPPGAFRSFQVAVRIRSNAVYRNSIHRRIFATSTSSARGKDVLSFTVRPR